MPGPAARKRPASPILNADEISDRTLISAIAGKAVWAMEVLYQRYNRLLYALVYRMVGNQQVTEDLMQEAYFAVWQHAHSYVSHSGEVRSWLISIFHHKAIDYLRSMQRRASIQQVELEQVDLQDGMTMDDAWDEVWQSVQRDLIRKAMLNLPREQRMVIELAYFQGWTQSEIAEGTHLPLGTVKARMRLGLLHLKRFLEHKDFGRDEGIS
ncbi:MAG TPA: sigma-70 family RNA polymerase sigma factor [Ktedonobacteraceae bacterium]